MTTSSTAAPAAPSPNSVAAAPARSVKTTAAATKTSAKAAAAAKPVAPTKKKVPDAKQATPQQAKAPAPAVTRDAKAKKPKLVRDSFTIPKDEYAVIETLKQRSAALAQPVKKSELLRAGLKVLAAMSDVALSSAVLAVPSIKTGRPKAEASPAVSIPAATKTTAKAARK
jgi:hypothetical protein